MKKIDSGLLKKFLQGIVLLIGIIALITICSGLISLLFGKGMVNAGIRKMISVFWRIFSWVFVKTFFYLLPPIIIYILIQLLVTHPVMRFMIGLGSIYLFWILSGGLSFSISSPINSLIRIIRLVFQIYFLTVLIIPQPLVIIASAVASFIGGIIVNSIPIGIPMMSVDSIVAMIVLSYFIMYLNVIASFVKKAVGHSAKIKNLFTTKQSVETGANVVISNNKRTPVELIKEGLTLLERSSFEDAEKLFEQALEINPNIASAYIGVLMAEQKKRTVSELVNSSILLENDELFQKALEIATPKMKQTLEKYVQINRKKFHRKKK